MSFLNNSTQSTTVGSGWKEQSADPFSVEKFEEMLDCINGQDDPAKCDAVGPTLKAELGKTGRDLWLNWMNETSKSTNLEGLDYRKQWDDFGADQADIGQIIYLAREGG